MPSGLFNLKSSNSVIVSLIPVVILIYYVIHFEILPWKVVV